PEIPVKFFGYFMCTTWCLDTLGPYGSVCPCMCFNDISDHSGIIHLLGLANTVTRTTLVTHLRYHFIFLRSLCEYARFVDIVRKWFLRVYVFTQLHGSQCGYRMRMVWCGNGTGVNIILFLRKHFTEILIVFCFWKSFSRLHSLTIVHITKRDDVDIRTFCK